MLTAPDTSWLLAWRSPIPGGQRVRRPAAPSVPIWTLAPGDDPGELVATITAPPSSAGDGLVYNDGAGVITGYRVRIAGVAQTFGPSLPRVVTADGFVPGTLVSVEAQALGYGGRPGQVSQRFVEARAGAAGPSAAGWTPGPGDDQGEVTATVTTAPASGGDGPSAGDGTGSTTGYRISIGGTVSDHGPSLPLSVTVGGFPFGVLVPVIVTPLGYGGRPGMSTSALVLPFDDPETFLLTVGGDHLTVGGERLFVSHPPLS